MSDGSVLDIAGIRKMCVSSPLLRHVQNHKVVESSMLRVMVHLCETESAMVKSVEKQKSLTQLSKFANLSHNGLVISKDR